MAYIVNSERSDGWDGEFLRDSAKDALEKELLNDDQVDALIELASIKHDLENFEIEELAKGTGDDFFFFATSMKTAYDAIEWAELPDVTFTDNYIELEEAVTSSDQETAAKLIKEPKERFHAELTDYLSAIDEKFGTNFCNT